MSEKILYSKFNLRAFFLVVFLSYIIFKPEIKAQNQQIDSIKKLCRDIRHQASNYKNDTLLIKSINSLCREFIFIGAYDKADSIANEAIKFEEQKLFLYEGDQVLFFKKQKASSNNFLGIVQSCKGNQTMALDYFNVSLKLSTELNDKKGVSSSLGSLGNVFKDQANYPRALECYFGALKLTEALKLDKVTAIHLANIGNVYQAINEYQKSLDYYFKALQLAKKMNDQRGITVDLGNIGMVYMHKKEYDKSLEYYFKSLEMAKTMDFKLHIVNTLGNIGDMYEKKKDYTKALNFLQVALTKAKEIEDNGGIARLKGSIGSVFVEQRKIKEAQKFLNDALSLATEVGDLNTIKEQHLNLCKLYQIKHDWKNAFIEYQLFVNTRDSLFNQENTKSTLRSELNFEYEKKATADSVKNMVEQQIKDAEISLQQSQLNQEKTKRFALYGGISIILLFTLFIVNRFRVIYKQKQIIELKEKETEKQNEIITLQKHLVEEKQTEILDSINYAKRIQYSLLANKKLLDENLKNYFLFFKPKDVVSGDFYWGSKTVSSSGVENFILITADSTGHGVPGAIMSMLNISCLNEAISADKLTEPADILNATRKKIIAHLSNDGSSEGGKDGMDCSLVSFDFKNKKLIYAAANNPVWIVRDKKLIALPANRMPIGKHDRDSVPFTQDEFALESGDVVYTLTDGFPDQFGGPKGKKFKYKQLEELLISISHEAMEIQNEKLNLALDTWKGNLEQVDDICVIGVRI